MNDHYIQKLNVLLLLLIMPNTHSTRGVSSEGGHLIVKCNHKHLAGNGMHGDLFLYFQAMSNASPCLMVSSVSNSSNGCGLDQNQMTVKTGGKPHWFIKVDIHNVMQQNVGMYQCIWKENSEHGEDFLRQYETEKMEFNLINATSHSRFTLKDRSRIVTLDMNFTPNQPGCELCWIGYTIITVISGLAITAIFSICLFRDRKREMSIKQQQKQLH